MPLSDELSKLFRDAMDWGRSYGQRLGTTYELLDEVAEQFADKARAIEAATAAPLLEKIEAEKASRLAAQEENIELKDACLKAESQAQRVKPLLAQIAQLEAQLAEARKDAERYRWLKQRPIDWSIEHSKNGWSTCYGFSEVDEAIDAAIAKEHQ